MEAGIKRDHSHTRAYTGSHYALSRWTSLHVFFFFPRQTIFPTRPQAPRGASPHPGPLETLCIWQVPNSCLCTTGWVPERRGGGRELQSSVKKKSQFSTPEHSPAPWLQPKARPSSALGNKYLYGDNYSIWEENPIKQEPCRAANAGTELEAATRPSSRLLPIMQELPVLTPLACPQKSTAAPAGSLRPPGPPQAASCIAEGSQKEGVALSLYSRAPRRP